jgi:hypothetical protein
LSELFDNFATHDFMVFDTRIACIHQYDQSGLIQGGWWVQDSSDITNLMALHGYVRANCQPFTLFQ